MQPVANGTGGAVQAAAGEIDAGDTVVVLPGDAPLITAASITALVDAHEASGAAATMATMVLEDPTGYGRVVRDAQGGVERVVETKAAGDASAQELEIDEVNSSIFAFDGAALTGALQKLSPDNAQRELYLPDVLPALRKAGHAVRAHRLPTPTRHAGSTIASSSPRSARSPSAASTTEHGRAGVTIVDPASTLIDVTVAIGEDTTIEPSSLSARHDEHRRALPGRPAHDPDRRHAARRDLDPALLRRRG